MIMVSANELLLEEDRALRLYFDDIASSKPLSREVEVALAARIQDGDQSARDELIQANLRFVIDVAKNYQHRGLSLPDLICAGNIGLITAAERFDGTKGYKFISYAVWWIKQSILQTIADHSRTVRLPLNKQALLKDISKVSRRLGQGRESAPAVEEIAAELDMPAEEILDTMLSARSVRSLDEAFEDDDERSLLSVLSDTDGLAPDTEVVNESVRVQIESLLGNLADRERYILRLYFGLDNEEPLTLEEIGGLMNLTRERVRQLKERALGKLRAPEAYTVLMSLRDEAETF